MSKLHGERTQFHESIMKIISIKPKKTFKIALKQLKKRRFVSRGTNVDNFFVSRETYKK